MRRFVLTVLFCAASGAALANPAATQALNEFRASQGRAPLSYDAKLERAAKAHAQDMVKNDFFSHSGSDGSDVGQRVRKARFEWCFVAENIAKGQQGLGKVMSAWAGSKGHRQNMLSRKAKAFALYEGADRTWVMVLAAPCR